MLFMGFPELVIVMEEAFRFTLKTGALENARQLFVQAGMATGQSTKCERRFEFVLLSPALASRN